MSVVDTVSVAKSDGFYSLNKTILQRSSPGI